MPTRRDFCLTVGAIAAATLLPRRAVLARLQDGTLKVSPLGEGRWIITEGGGNCLLLATEQGPVLVDSKVTAVARELHETVKATAAAPKMLINTHHHGDHTGGNFMFSADAEIIAHVALRPRLQDIVDSRVKPTLEEQRKSLAEAGKTDEAEALARTIAELDVDDFAADRSVSDALDLDFGGVAIQLRHFEPGHTDNDLVVLLPDANVLHTGDLLFNKLHPFIDRPAGANTRGWQRTLVEVIKLCNEDTVVVPGHGEVTDIDGLRGQIAYFDMLRAAVEQQIQRGRSREEVVAIEPDALSSFGFEQLRPRALGAMYDELMAEQNGGGN